MVYIQEAHAEDVWPIGVAGQPRLLAPRSTAERLEVALRFRAQSCWGGAMLVDGTDNSFESAFAAWPFRFFIVSSAGKLLHKAQPTSDLTYCPCELEQALHLLLQG